MGNQLVVSGNRILAYGLNRYVSVNGTVVDTENGNVFENSTVVDCKESLPTDIDSVGYEYHSGAFVPCAPYGVAENGYVPVLCTDACNAIKSSGLLLSNFQKFAVGSYTGTNTGSKTFTFNFKAVALFVTAQGYSTSKRYHSGLFVIEDRASCYFWDPANNTVLDGRSISVSNKDNNITLSSSVDFKQELIANSSGIKYTYIALG